MPAWTVKTTLTFGCLTRGGVAEVVEGTKGTIFETVECCSVFPERVTARMLAFALVADDGVDGCEGVLLNALHVLQRPNLHIQPFLEHCVTPVAPPTALEASSTEAGPSG